MLGFRLKPYKRRRVRRSRARAESYRTIPSRRRRLPRASEPLGSIYSLGAAYGLLASPDELIYGSPASEIKAFDPMPGDPDYVPAAWPEDHPAPFPEWDPRRQAPKAPSRPGRAGSRRQSHSLLSRLYYANPNFALNCLRRKVRQEVMFALKKAGRAHTLRKKTVRRTESSNYGC